MKVCKSKACIYKATNQEVAHVAEVIKAQNKKLHMWQEFDLDL